MLAPILTVNVVAVNIPVIPNDKSSGIVNEGVKFKPSSLTNSLISPKSWFDDVVISNCPVVLLYDAVLCFYVGMETQYVVTD